MAFFPAAENRRSFPSRLFGLFAREVTWARIAWWGLVSPRSERNPLVVVQAVVRDGDRLLLAIRNDLRGWELPGGTVENEEPAEQALKREVREETGLDVTIERHVGNYRRTGFRPHLAKVYECRKVGGREQINHETRALRWFHPLLLPDTLFPWYEEPVRDAFVPEASPVEREERHGLPEIKAGMKIDLAMRWRGDEKQHVSGSVESAPDSGPSDRQPPQA